MAAGRVKGQLPERSSGRKSDRLPVRVAEHNAALPCGDGQQVSETCTLATTLLDHQAAPASAVRYAYLAPVERVGDRLRRGQDHHRRAPETARPGRCCAPAPCAWSSRKPGHG